MDSKLYFETIDGGVINSSDIKKAYYIMIGKQLKEKEVLTYARFLPSVKRHISNPTPEELYRLGSTVNAIVLYRELHDCSLTEAKKAVEEFGRKEQEQ